MTSTSTTSRPRRFARLSTTVPRIVAVLFVATTVGVGLDANAADDPTLERLATCQDSWLDWKEPDPRMTAYRRYVHTQLRSEDDGQSFSPRSAERLLGMPLVQVYPQSVGMGVGFSATVDADATKARVAIEQRMGHPMTCTRGDGVLSCELKLAERKTVVLMADLGVEKPTLVGCYYFYRN